jgi:hypothetical protein
MINIHTVSLSASWNCLSSRRTWICRTSGTACRHHTWPTDATYTRPWWQRTTSLGLGTVTDWMNKHGSTVLISMQSVSKANKYGSSYAAKKTHMFVKQSDHIGIYDSRISFSKHIWWYHKINIICLLFYLSVFNFPLKLFCKFTQYLSRQTKETYVRHI